METLVSLIHLVIGRNGLFRNNARRPFLGEVYKIAPIATLNYTEFNETLLIIHADLGR